MILDAVLRQVRPPSPLAGRLSAQSPLFALGQGAFMTGSALFFTQIVGLSAAQVGLGLTCAGIAAFLAALPTGKLVGRTDGPASAGRLQGSASLSGPLGKVWAPALFTLLAMNWGAAGWLVIAGIIVVATIALHPSTRLARRFLEAHVPAEVLADARASSPVPEAAA